MAKHVVWKDITALCRAAAAEMTDDQPMTAVDDFSLLDSMSAVELFDPKMDQCCGLTGSVITSELLQFKGSNGTGVVSATALASLLQVLFVNEVSFLDGAALMETIHQCIFMWKDSWVNIEINDQPTVQALLAFCKSLSLSLGHIFDGVLAADIFEDEDFQSQHREYLAYDFIDSVAAKEEFSKVLAKFEAVNSDNTTPTVEGYIAAMLSVRLKLQQLFYSLAENTRGIITEYSRVMKKNQRNAGTNVPKEVASSTPDSHIAQCVDIRDLSTETLISLQKLEAYHKELVALQSTAELSTSERVHNLTTPSECSDIQFAFCSTLAKLIQVSPVRFVNLKPFTDSISYLCNMCEELTRVCSISIDIISANKTEATTLSFDELLNVSYDLSSRRPHILVRSFYLAVLHTQSANIRTMLERSMSKRGLPNVVVQSELIHQQWLEQNPFSASWETLKSFCINRNRLQPRMDQVLALWGAVANDALYVDEQFRIQNDLGEIRQQWCGNWALTMTTLMMDYYMSVVVEMDLLSLQEMDFFYWYWDYICSTHSFAADRLRETRLQMDGEMYQQAVLEAADAKKATKNSKKKGKEDPPIPLPKAIDMTLSEYLMKGRGHLCRGLFRVSVIAQQLKLIDKAENKYMSWANRFDTRFKAFQSVVNPPALAYTDFLNTLIKGSNSTTTNENSESDTDITKLKIDVNTILSGASICFQNARKFFDEIRRLPMTSYGDYEVQNEALFLTKVAVANSVATLKTGQITKDPTAQNNKCSLNKAYHKHYPVIEVTKQT